MKKDVAPESNCIGTFIIFPSFVGKPILILYWLSLSINLTSENSLSPIISSAILLLSVFLIATLASYFADFIKKHQWLGYLGLIVILIIALQLIIGGLVNYEVLSINEKFKFLFAIW